MKAREYGAWPSRNILLGGQRQSFDEYNREYKKVTYTSAEEYACRNVKEYHHYSEYNDTTEIDRNKRTSSDKSQDSRVKRMRVAQQLVAIVAGSTIIVSTYTAMTKQQETPTPLPAAVQTQDDGDNDFPVVPDAANEYEASWEWSEDFSSVILTLKDKDGNVVGELPAQISVETTEEPTCNKEGLSTYTASATYEDKEYSDTQTQPIEPLGHSFNSGQEIVLENGQGAIDYECERCHEHFTVATSATEIDE